MKKTLDRVLVVVVAGLLWFNVWTIFRAWDAEAAQDDEYTAEQCRQLDAAEYTISEEIQ